MEQNLRNSQQWLPQDPYPYKYR